MRLEPMPTQREIDIVFVKMMERYQKSVRREVRRARIVRASKVVGASILGIGIGIILIGIISYVCEIPLSGW